jgi:hypothetical protein
VLAVQVYRQLDAGTDVVDARSSGSSKSRMSQSFTYWRLRAVSRVPALIP